MANAIIHPEQTPEHTPYFGSYVVTRDEKDHLQSSQDARLSHLQTSLSSDSDPSPEQQQPKPISGKFKEASVWPWEHREMEILHREVAEMRAEESMQRVPSKGKGHSY